MTIAYVERNKKGLTINCSGPDGNAFQLLRTASDLGKQMGKTQKQIESNKIENLTIETAQSNLKKALEDGLRKILWVLFGEPWAHQNHKKSEKRATGKYMKKPTPQNTEKVQKSAKMTSTNGVSKITF